MKVILTKDFPTLGKKGMVKNVKDGYFRNYLFPEKIAVPANEDLIKKAKIKQEKESLKMKEIIAKAVEIKEKLGNVKIVLSRKTSAKGKLFGSIGEQDILEAMEKEFKIKLAKENIILEEHLKSVGEHQVKIKLTEEVEFAITVVIEKL